VQPAASPTQTPPLSSSCTSSLNKMALGTESWQYNCSVWIGGNQPEMKSPEVTSGHLTTGLTTSQPATDVRTLMCFQVPKGKKSDGCEQGWPHFAYKLTNYFLNTSTVKIIPSLSVNKHVEYRQWQKITHLNINRLQNVCIAQLVRYVHPSTSPSSSTKVSWHFLLHSVLVLLVT